MTWPPRKRILIVLVLICLTACSIIATISATLLLGEGNAPSEAVITGEAARDPINTLLEARIPGGAANLTYTYTENFLDWNAQATFTLPADEAEAWLQSAGFCFTLPIPETNTPGLYEGSCQQDARQYTISVEQTEPAMHTLTIGVYTF